MRTSVSTIVLFPLLAGTAFGWGCEGHQMVALIARAHLTPEVSAAVDQLLAQSPIDPALKRFCQDPPPDPMSVAATWPDDIRTTNHTGAWHFVDIPLTATATGGSVDAWCPPVAESANGKDRPGCVTNAIAYQLAILRDKNQPAMARADALRYIIHFAGDIHQPLHDSDNGDRGGNCTAMKFFQEDRPANLHAIWDYKLLERELTAKKTTPAEYAHTLDQKFATEGEAWRSQKPDPVAWAWEGHRLAVATTYGDLKPSIPLETPNPAADCNAERDKVTALHIVIGDKYFEDSAPKIDEQIAKAGNRLAALLNQTLQPIAGPQHQLAASPATVVVGNYWSESKPVLTIKSGETVTVETVGTASVAALEGLKVPADQIPASLRAITRAMADKTLDRGPGGHILTGPIFIEGAEPGDVLEVHIENIAMPVPWAYNGFRPTSGFLKEDFKQNYGRIIKLDREHMLALFGPGISIPLHPFFGSMGVAPPAADGRINSAPPGIHAGNLDNRNLVAGSTLYIPIHVKGALFQVGDGHAGQGDGEVDITAMETPLVGTFRFVVRKDLHLKWPRAETPTHFIVMGTDEDLTVAATIAVREMIDFLVAYRGLTREEAYVLSSIAADFEITQLVDGRKGVHGMIAKSIFQ
ncbi:MAG: acetamidase/formamidase family protein [Acidobacteriota bacterium]|nr:acetamidase/formamidase family protein [Acidobacteriota bacterium]